MSSSPSSQTEPTTTIEHDFLSGGGRMGAFIRAYPWAESTLGSPSAWPQPLRTALRILLTTNHPIFVFWGPHCICFYNDAYSQSLGPEKHPLMLGARGREAWDEIWPWIGPQIALVMAGKGATWHEDHLIPITRFGKREEVYWTYSYGPIDDESAPNNVGGVLVICTETTKKVLAERRLAFQLALSDRLRGLNDAGEIKLAAAEMLGQHLGADRAGYGEIDEFETTGHIDRDWTQNSTPSLVGTHRLEAFGPELIRELRAGRTVRFADAFNDPLCAGSAEAYRQARARAGITIPLIRNGRLVAAFFVHQAEPRLWTDAEMDLAQETAERTWDAVQRSHVETHLRRSERRWRALFDQAPNFIAILLGPEHTIEYANHRYRQLVGERDLIGRTIREALPDIVGQGYYELLDTVYRTGEPYTAHDARVVLARTPGGPLEERFVDFVYQPVLDAAGAVSGIFVDGYDATARVRSAQALGRHEEELRNLNETLEARVDTAVAERKLWADILENAGTLIAAINLQYDFLAVNKAYADEFEYNCGIRPRAGDNLLALLETEEQRAGIRRRWGRALAGEEFTIVRELGTKDHIRPYELRYSSLRDRGGMRIGALQFAYDVSDRVRDQARLAEAQESLRQSQKMEAVGQLTGGIAHDFNNLLTGIIGSLDMMQRRFAQGRSVDVNAYASAAMTAANRAASLTHRLLAFSRRQPLDPKTVDVNRLIAGMDELLSRTIGESIELEIIATQEVWRTRCDPHQLENALLNLAINARDAMPAGGKLTITAVNSQIDSAIEADARDIAMGEYVCIKVTDTGTGMTPDVISRAFDPFFTTKPIGQGTGLGLSMIYGFTRQSDGYARIDSQVGIGTSVQLFLPRYHGPDDFADDLPPTTDVAPRAQHDEIVLIVEDEQVVRDLVVDVLQDLGYRALQATDGPSGLRILQSDTRIDLLVTDIGLPGLNGRDVANAARELRPALKVLFITGYAHNAVGKDVLESGMEMITKPFAIEALATRIEAMLNE